MAVPLGEGLLCDVRSASRRWTAVIADAGGDELEPHRQRAVAALERIGAEVTTALADDAGEGVDLLGVAAVGRPLDVFRRTQLPFFTHYGQDERYLTLVAAHVSDEAAFPMPTPIVGTFSNTGYWTDPDQRTLCLPADEQSQLLSFPDIVHELGHVLLSEAGKQLLVEFIQGTLGPYTASLGPVDGDGGFASRLYRQHQVWVVEFVADVVAAYVCGPAYGWQHIRLNAQSGALIARALQQPWHPAAPGDSPERLTHPADSARTAMIASALRLTGQEAGAGRLEDEWRGLTTGAGPAPPTYVATYPEAVLRPLAQNTVDWCRSLGMVVFASAGEETIVGHVDRAWARQLSDPVAFAEEEAQRVAALRRLVEQAAA